MSTSVKIIDCTLGNIYEERINEANDSSKDLLNNIYDAKPDVINLLMKHYKDQDIRFPHPVLHEACEQCGCDYESTKNIVHKRQNEQIKYFLTHEKFQNKIHDCNYTDKYGNTALERLAGRMLTMNDKNLINWIQNSDFGLGKEYNKYLTPENITQLLDSYGAPSGKIELSDKFPTAKNFDT